jgi:hypothetical protein
MDGHVCRRICGSHRCCTRLFPHVRCKSPSILHACREARAGGFWAHVAGTAYKMVVEHLVAGLRIDNYRTTLPFKKGLSSSAAVCIAVSITTKLLHHAAHAADVRLEMGKQSLAACDRWPAVSTRRTACS